MKSQKLSWADCACGKGAVRLGFDGMNDIRKLDGILDEEDRNIVADQIPVSFLGIDLRRQSRARRARDRRIPCCRRRWKSARRPASSRRGAGRDRPSCISTGIHRSRRNRARRNRGHGPPARECAHGRSGISFAEMEILHQGWSARADLQRVLIVRHGAPCDVVKTSAPSSAIWWSSPPTPL